MPGGVPDTRSPNTGSPTATGTRRNVSPPRASVTAKKSHRRVARSIAEWTRPSVPVLPNSRTVVASTARNRSPDGGAGGTNRRHNRSAIQRSHSPDARNRSCRATGESEHQPACSTRVAVSFGEHPSAEWTSRVRSRTVGCGIPRTRPNAPSAAAASSHPSGNNRAIRGQSSVAGGGETPFIRVPYPAPPTHAPLP